MVFVVCTIVSFHYIDYSFPLITHLVHDRDIAISKENHQGNKPITNAAVTTGHCGPAGAVDTIKCAVTPAMYAGVAPTSVSGYKCGYKIYHYYY